MEKTAMATMMIICLVSGMKDGLLPKEQEGFEQGSEIWQ